MSGFKTQRLDRYELGPHLAGAKVLDIGCNRGLWSIQAALAGARAVHGCDNYRPGIEAARQVLADFPGLDVRFEVVDLSRGADALACFDQDYDVVLLLSVIHKLRKQMPNDRLVELLRSAARRTERFLVCRGNPDDLAILYGVMRPRGFVDDGTVADELRPAVIWRREQA